MLSLPGFERARVVALYSSLPDEVDTSALLRALWAGGRRVALPRIRVRELQLLEVNPGGGLVRGSLGIAEPPESSPVVEPAEVDVFIVPGVCFDRSGRRLGRGWGCYDRLFVRSRGDALRIGLCFSDRLIAEVPAGERDEPVHWIVTERELIRAGHPDTRPGP